MITRTNHDVQPTLKYHHLQHHRREGVGALYAHDGKIWLNQQQMAELFGTSKQSISHHIINILKEKELDVDSVAKHYLTTASDGKQYDVVF